MRHVYCDESGGTDPASPCFLVTAVAIDPRSAGHLIGRLRKRTGLKGEAHGHTLDARRRDLFLRHLHDHGDAATVAVVLRRGAALAAALAEAGREAVLRTHMLAEAVGILVTHPTGLPLASPIGVTIDGGRYKRTELERERGRMPGLLAATGSAPGINVQYVDSERATGLQVADIVGNTVLRSVGGYASPREEGHLSALRRKGLLRVHDAVLPALRPAWQEPGNEEAAP